MNKKETRSRKLLEDEEIPSDMEGLSDDEGNISSYNEIN